MKKIVIVLLLTALMTGCQNKPNKAPEKELEENKQEGSVVKDQIFIGLEFITMNISGREITTQIINNTGALYEPSNFKIVVKDKEGNLIDTIIGNTKEAINSGETKTVISSTNVDLSNAYRIQYSIN